MAEYKIKPYEELKTTTMTVVISLDCEINILCAFHLLPVTKIEVNTLRKIVKCKIPLCAPGSVISVRHKKNVRGIIRNDALPFKNAISIDISTSLKNLGIKLSPCKIHMCGAASRENALEAVEHIFTHLKTVQKHLDTLSNSEVRESVIKWFESTKGETCYRDNIQHIPGNIPLIVHRKLKDNLIKIPAEIPEDLDAELMQYLVSLANDFIYHSDFMKKLNLVCTTRQIFTGNLKIKDFGIAMENYNYSLGFKINRGALNSLINGVHGFIPRYDNALSVNVTIDLPYTVESSSSSIKRRKNKVPHHTFLVYRSGSVTQSGPGGKLMEDAYYLFMKTIMSLRPEIEYLSNKET